MVSTHREFTFVCRFAQEIRIYDEVEKANSTLVIIKSVDLHPLPENIFTKAWLESKSR